MSGSRSCGGILDTDFQMAFDFIIMLWVFRVLETKGVSKKVVERLMNLYKDNITVVVVNNVPEKAIKNTSR